MGGIKRKMKDISISDRRRGEHPRVAKSDWDGKSVRQDNNRNTRVIAYGADGSVIIFDSLAEATAFFGLKRVDTLRRYIDKNWSMPDGSTYCDYLL